MDNQIGIIRIIQGNTTIVKDNKTTTDVNRG